MLGGICSLANYTDVYEETNKTVSLIFVLLCVLSFHRQPFRFSLINVIGCMLVILGPVVQSVVSLTSSLRVISLTVLADSIYSILIFFAEKI